MADSQKGICCIQGEILIDNLCKKVDEIDIIDNCYSFDIKTKQCLKCKKDYQL